MLNGTSFAEFQPCTECTEPELFTDTMELLDHTGNYAPYTDLVVDITAGYLKSSQEAGGISPAEVAATDQENEAALDIAVDATKAAEELDKIRERLRKRLSRIDCVAYCGGFIKSCPKLDFAGRAIAQSTGIMRSVSETIEKLYDPGVDQQG